MKYSILIPIYNVEKYIHHCLGSIVTQEFSDFELILIDDGSTDRSGAICDEYSRKYSNIIVVHQENKGLLNARRTAFGLAKGDYCIVVDSDDFISDAYFKTVNHLIDVYAPDLIIIGAKKYLDGNTYTHKAPAFEKETLFIGRKEPIYQKILEKKISNTLWSKVFKRELLDLDNSYAELSEVNMGEDLVQSLPLVTKANSVLYTNEQLYYYRTNAMSLTQKFNVSCINSLEKVNKVLDQYVSIWGLANGKELAAIRYLKDVSDILSYAIKSHDTKNTDYVYDHFRKSEYFHKKMSDINYDHLESSQKILYKCLVNEKKTLYTGFILFLETKIMIKHLLGRG